MKKKDISIIIVNWNTDTLLRECVGSIYEETKECDFEIIIVDNASTDDSIDMTEKRFQGLRVIRNGSNLGFSAGNNIGVREAEADLIVLLNPDTRVTGGALDKLHSFMENSNGRVGAVGPMLVNADKSFRRDQGASFPGILSALFQYFFLSHLFGLPGIYVNRYTKRTRDVDWIAGTCLCCPRELYTGVGGLDEGYFLYAEDMDFCQKLKKKGYRVVFYPAAEVVHLSKQSLNKQDESVFRLQLESVKRFYDKNHSRLSYLVFKNVLFAGCLLRFLVFGIFCIFRPSPAIREKARNARSLLRYVYA